MTRRKRRYFAKDELWISNGCVRVEDYKRVARFLFDGQCRQGSNPKVEQEVQLPQPVPVYMTYLTVAADRQRRTVRRRPLRPRRALMERYGAQLLAAVDKR